MEVFDILLAVLQVLSGLALLGNFVGNILVITVIHKVKSMQTITNYLLWTLAQNDLLFGIYGFVEIVQFYLRGNPEAQADSYLAYTSLHFYVSCFTLMAIAVERFYAVLKPFVHRARTSTKLIRNVVTCIWILGTCLSAPEWSVPGSEHTYFRKIYILSAYTTCIVLSAAGIGTCYGKIIYQIWYKTDERQTTNAAVMKSRQSLTKLLLGVTLVFFVCWCPLLGRGLVKSAENERIYALCSGTLALIGTAVNPVLYSLHSVKFRQALRKMFGGCRKSRLVGDEPRTRAVHSPQTLDTAL